MKPVRKKDQIGSGFGLVFVKFWSGFSPDFALFGPEIIIFTTTDEARAGLGQAAHLLPHLQAVVGGHGYPEEARSRCPTGR